MQPQPISKFISSTQLAGNKLLKRSVNFLRRDQKATRSFNQPSQQVKNPIIKRAQKPVEESFCDQGDVMPGVSSGYQHPTPALITRPVPINRPITSQPPLIAQDQLQEPVKLGTPVDEMDQHLNSPYTLEDIDQSFRQPSNTDFTMPPFLSDLLPDKNSITQEPTKTNRFRQIAQTNR